MDKLIGDVIDAIQERLESKSDIEAIAMYERHIDWVCAAIYDELSARVIAEGVLERDAKAQATR